jgi:ketosteroid isomerase-like protein
MPMRMSRRNLAIAGAVAVGMAGVLRGSVALADASDEATIKDNVEVVRKALLSADKGALEKLTAADLSYGHSSGKVQNQAEFIDGVVNRKAVVKSIAFPNLKVAVVGDNAIVRHGWVSESETDGKVSHVSIEVLGVWQKQADGWKLLARQGYKPTA